MTGPNVLSGVKWSCTARDYLHRALKFLRAFYGLGSDKGTAISLIQMEAKI